MAPNPPRLASPAAFFVLRTPLLPRSTLTSFSEGLRAAAAGPDQASLEEALVHDRKLLTRRLRELVSDPIIREALFVASPSLHESLEAWLTAAEPTAAAGVINAVVRYMARMSCRSVPFGLFSGCTVGVMGAETRFELAPRAQYRRHTRLDMHYLSALCEALRDDPSLRGLLPVRPSSGLYETGGQLRYAEGRVEPDTRARSYHLVSAEMTEPIQQTLARASGGAMPSELATALVEHDPDIEPLDAREFIDSLIESQILVSELEPAITGKEPVIDLLETLVSRAPAAEATGVLRVASEAIGELDRAGLGHATKRYRAIAETLEALPAKAEIARLFQVDLYKTPAVVELGPAVIAELERTAGLLARLARPIREDNALRQFKQAFDERYEGRRVPLSLALDEEVGIGFSSAMAHSADPTPLLAGLGFPSDPLQRPLPFGASEAVCLRRLCECLRNHEREWVLDESDIEEMSPPHPLPLPDSFALHATVMSPSPSAIERGEFRVEIHGVPTSSGAALLGRFCHGDPALHRFVKDYLAAEEAMRPDAIFAEVVHLPEGRMGNILCRPDLRGFEIPYLGRSGVPASQQIPLADLEVSIEHGRVVLWSKRLEREIVPRLTSAHNWTTAALGVYRFLCAVQHDRDTHSIGWSWGALAGAPFLPRVRDGRSILSPAAWRLSMQHIAALGGAANEAGRFRATTALRKHLSLPRWIALADGDNVLPVDLDNVLHVESFVQLIKSRQGVSLVELIDPDELVACGVEGRFDHEVVVPFLSASTRSSAPPRTPTIAEVQRTFTPASEWLYVKLYTGTATKDAVLEQVVAPVVRDAQAAGIAHGWFFIRYNDPHPHLRLRIRGDARRLLSETLPALHESARPFVSDDRLWRVQLDSYQRETERYGGPEGIELAERVFELDSDAVLAIVERLEGDEGADARWRLALRGIHLLMCDFGLTLAARADLMLRIRTGFGREHHLAHETASRHARVETTLFERQLGQRFRAERADLFALVETAPGSEHPLDPGFVILAERSTRIAPVAQALIARRECLSVSIDELVASLVHMHANRLLRSRHRAQELVLYDFLLRIYESEIARARRPAK